MSSRKFVVLFIAMLPATLDAHDINFGWKFARGAHPEAVESGFDDSSWQDVDLPHDWAIAGPFGKPKDSGSTGKLPWDGEGYYRKTFQLSAKDKNNRLQFIFDGVMASPTVFLNGKKVGAWRYGYNSFWIDATSAAKWGSQNVLTVHADTRSHKSRWYPGAGIYRKVTMRIVEQTHFPVWGVTITTPEITNELATVVVSAKVVGPKKDASLICSIVDPEGNEIVNRRMELTSAPVVVEEFEIKQPVRWEVDSPQLYSVRTMLEVDGKKVQTETTTFGIRTIEFTADDGFHLNGRRLQLNGVNLHHGHGPLGAAFFPRAMQRQLEVMKEMGVNAIRTSHNPTAPEFLDLCDRMGFVVWNELFDKYGPTAGVDCDQDTFVREHAEKEVVNFVDRDRNHPCVILWSIGNEIHGLKDWHVKSMASFFRARDTTRPITIGSHIPDQAKQNILDSLDVSGWNYGQKYLVSRELHPQQPLIYAETASAFGTRGAYKLKLPSNKLDYGNDGEINAHMLTAAPWSDIPEVEFERVRKHKYLAGEFVWTGFDYLGEPTPYISNKNNMASRVDGRLARSSYFGIVDLAGFPKDSYFLYRSHWKKDSHTLHLAPHWNWAGDEGQRVPVVVYTDGDEAELFLNGKSLGRRSKRDFDSIETDSLSYGRAAAASSEEIDQDAGGNVVSENFAQKAFDGNPNTRWCAASETLPQFLQVDLGKTYRPAFARIQWEKEAATYEFVLEGSVDKQSWISVDAKVTNHKRISDLAFDAKPLRFLRLRVTKCATGDWASVSEFDVFEKSSDSEDPYFKVVDAYRIRWPEVVYQPGVLNAVAYKNGERIGEVAVRTTGKPVSLRLTPDRTELRGDGFDLGYITVEALDANGLPCPLADDKLKFTVDGPATLAGVANGDAMSHDSFVDDTHALFYGKAIVVLRTKRAGGKVVLSVSGDGLGETQVMLISLPNR